MARSSIDSKKSIDQLIGHHPIQSAAVSRSRCMSSLMHGGKRLRCMFARLCFVEDATVLFLVW